MPSPSGFAYGKVALRSCSGLECPKCEGRMQRIAYVTQQRVIEAILECVGRKEDPP